MRSLILTASLVVVAGLLALVFWPGSDAPLTLSESEPVSSSGGSTDTPSEESGSDAPRLERRRSTRAKADEDQESEPASLRTEAQDDVGTPLDGLEVVELSASQLTEYSVPDDFEGGVLIQRVAPDSPADEVRLVPGDVIVRAHLQMVKTVDDLEEIVGDREFSTVTFIRQGQILQVVLKRPFRVN